MDTNQINVDEKDFEIIDDVSKINEEALKTLSNNKGDDKDE